MKQWLFFAIGPVGSRPALPVPYLYRLDDDDALEEGQDEGDQPLVGLLAAPLHAVQDGEECRRDDAEDAHCAKKHVVKVTYIVVNRYVSSNKY